MCPVEQGGVRHARRPARVRGVVVHLQVPPRRTPPRGAHAPVRACTYARIAALSRKDLISWVTRCESTGSVSRRFHTVAGPVAWQDPGVPRPRGFGAGASPRAALRVSIALALGTALPVSTTRSTSTAPSTSTAGWPDVWCPTGGGHASRTAGLPRGQLALRRCGVASVRGALVGLGAVAVLGAVVGLGAPVAGEVPISHRGPGGVGVGRAARDQPVQGVEAACPRVADGRHAGPAWPESASAWHRLPS